MASNNLCRSLVNHTVEVSRAVLKELNVPMPPFADWTISQWEKAGEETREIRDCMLGWDVTDFGSGRFSEIGRCLFTLRNGKSNDSRYPKTYAEKLLIEPEGQKSPMHYHRSKREDIINRGGGDVIVVLRPVGPDDRPGDGNLIVQVDGISHTRKAGEENRLKPGESLSIPPGTFHQFWAAEGSGTRIQGGRYAVSSEVSSVCDDWNDNVFIDEWACRFPTITEDVARTVYLCSEYPKLG